MPGSGNPFEDAVNGGSNPFEAAVNARKSNPFESYAAKGGQKKSEPGPIKKVIAAGEKAYSKPMQAYDAIFGSGERFVQGSASGLGEGIYEALHPNDPNRTAAQLEKIESIFGLGGKKGLAKVGIDTGFQAALDPLTYTNPFALLGKIPGAAKLVGKVAETAGKVPAVQGLEDFFKLVPKEELENYKPHGIPGADTLAALWRNALFVNPLPHTYNLARQAYYAGGLPAVAKMLQHMAKGVPEDVKRRMLEADIHPAEYVTASTPKWIHPQQKFLTRSEESARAAVMQGLEKKAKPRMKPIEGEMTRIGDKAIGEEVGKSFGQMGQKTSKAVKLAQAFGAPFAPWRFGVVPQTMMNATLKHPQRPERYARLLDTYNQDTNSNIEFGGPLEDFTRMAADPVHYTATTLGPLGQLGYAFAKGPSAAERAAISTATGYIPGYSLLESIPQLDPYKEGPDVLRNLLLRLLGGYESTPPKKP